MRLILDLLFNSAFAFCVYVKIKQLEQIINNVFKLHLEYIDVRDKQQEAIKNMYEMFNEQNRKHKVEAQLNRINGGNLTPNSKFWDDEE
jgi:esterase/lipase